MQHAEKLGGVLDLLGPWVASHTSQLQIRSKIEPYLKGKENRWQEHQQ